MKKVISTMLVLVMVLAVIATIPMTASAATTYNTSRYFNNNSTTGLDAYSGTPTMGAASGASTIKEAVWDNALKLTLNSSTNQFMIDGTVHSSANSDVYMLWDADNLYILHDVRAWNINSASAPKGQDGKTDQKTTTTPFPYSGHEVNMFNILLPRDFSADDMSAKSFMVFVMPCLSNSEVTGKTTVATGDIYEGVVRVRTNCFTSATGNSGSKVVLGYDESYGAGLRTYIEKTDAGYISETKIPWSFLDSTSGKDFAGLSASEKAGKTFGVKINHLNGYAMNNSGMTVDGVAMNNDTAGYDPVTLLTEKGTIIENPAPVVDYDYWLNSTNGQFITKNPKNGGQTYEISTAAQLVGLSEILESLAYNETTRGLNALGLASNAEKALLTRGNTFVLKNDIDFNPGLDCYNFSGFEVAKYKNTPVAFKGLDAFYGVFDGQGHTISGILNLTAAGGANGSTADWGGLIGRLGQGGVKNLVLDNSRIISGNDRGFGGVVGTLYATAYTQSSDDAPTMFIENVYIGENFYMDGTNKSGTSAMGGIVGAEWSSGYNKTATVNLENLVFNGRFVSPKNQAIVRGYIAGRINKSAAGTTYSVTAKDCFGIADNEDGSVLALGGNNTAFVSNVRSLGTIKKNAKIPASAVPYWTHIEGGAIVPVELADMLSGVKWQATQASGGEFKLRLVAEIESLDWQAVGFEVVLNDGTTNLEFDNIDNAVAYTSILAAGETKTADDLGVVDGDYLYVFTLSGLDASKTYTATVKAVYTDTEGNIVESSMAHTLTGITAWDGN